MNTKTTSTTTEAIEAWELYCEGKFDTVIDRYEATRTSDLHNLVNLASLELSQKLTTSTKKNSIFATLQDGMSAYHSGDHQNCATLLGDWLLHKDYFSASILERFNTSATKSESWGMIQKVCKKYFKHEGYRNQLLPSLVLSFHHTGKNKEAIKLFESHKEQLDTHEIWHKVALSYLAIGNYKQADALLLPLYKKIYGHSYQSQFEKHQQNYSNPNRIEELTKSKKRNSEEDMELGLSLLFTGEYKLALKIFKKVNF